MPTIGVNVAVFQEDQMLLTQREDFEVWCLPGGSIDPGESIAQSALRETFEETGLGVRLTRLVGVYSRPGTGSFVNQVFLFAAEPTGGELKTQPDETIDLGFFARDGLPQDLLQGQRRRIMDAWEGVGGSAVWSQNQTGRSEPRLTRHELYALRDRSSLSRPDFYKHYVEQSGPSGEVCEIPSAGYHDYAVQPEAKMKPDGAEPNLAADVAVIHDGKILLALREDYQVWCIPGGMVDPGESIAQAAGRELLEETGLEVILQRFTGVYSELGWLETDLHVVLFTSRISSGKLNPQAGEVLDLRFFALNDLPDNMLYGHRRRAMDALAGIGGSAVWTQSNPWPFDPALSRVDIYRMRDSSGLSRLDFYNHYFNKDTSANETQELDKEK
jgi:ADP-ribose pyrophosphatase YjhB (NUDIX family)